MAVEHNEEKGKGQDEDMEAGNEEAGRTKGELRREIATRSQKNTKGRSKGGRGTWVMSVEKGGEKGGGQEEIRVKRRGRKDKGSGGGREEKLRAKDEAEGEEERSKKRYLERQGK